LSLRARQGTGKEQSQEKIPRLEVFFFDNSQAGVEGGCGGTEDRDEISESEWKNLS
jgi:hypothetical protein